MCKKCLTLCCDVAHTPVFHTPVFHTPNTNIFHTLNTNMSSTLNTNIFHTLNTNKHKVSALQCHVLPTSKRKRKRMRLHRCVIAAHRKKTESKVRVFFVRCLDISIINCCTVRVSTNGARTVWIVQLRTLHSKVASVCFTEQNMHYRWYESNKKQKALGIKDYSQTVGTQSSFPWLHCVYVWTRR
jgi:ferredoxin-like protein FixX